MQILVFTPFYGRQHISEIFHAGIERLRNNFDIEVLAIVSTPEDEKWCKEKSYITHFSPNKPIGRKMNVGIQKALSMPNWRRMLIMGSDDLLSTEGLEKLIDADDLICGFNKMFVYDSKNKISGLFEYHKGTRTIGAGRLLHRSVFENTFERTMYSLKKSAVEVEIGKKIADTMVGRGFGSHKHHLRGIWEDKLDSNLDNSMQNKLALLGYPITCIEDEKTHILDIKTEFNIHSYQILEFHETSTLKQVSSHDWFLSEKEKELIQAL